MEETLIKVTDVKGTVLKPIDATFKVEYNTKERPQQKKYW